MVRKLFNASCGPDTWFWVSSKKLFLFSRTKNRYPCRFNDADYEYRNKSSQNVFISEIAFTPHPQEFSFLGSHTINLPSNLLENIFSLSKYEVLNESELFYAEKIDRSIVNGHT